MLTSPPASLGFPVASLVMARIRSASHAAKAASAPKKTALRIVFTRIASIGANEVMRRFAAMRHVKSHRAGSAFVAFGFAVAMMGTTLPTPLYPLYDRAFDLAAVLTPVIFATYAFGVVATLLFFGYLSDEIGRRPVMVAALCLSAASAVTFLLAHGLTALLIGRVLSGLSAGIASGTATAWLVDLAGRRGKQHATLLAVAANIGGLALGPLVAGLLAGLAPAPLRLPFVVNLALLAPALLGVLVAPETLAVNDRHIKLRMQNMRVPPEVADIFPPAAIVGVCAFAVAGVFSAVAPEFLGNELGDKSPVRARPAGVSVLRDVRVGAADRQSDPEASRARRRVRRPDRRSGIARGGAGGAVDAAAVSCRPPSRASARGSRSASASAPSTRRSATSGARPTPPISSSSTAGSRFRSSGSVSWRCPSAWSPRVFCSAASSASACSVFSTR